MEIRSIFGFAVWVLFGMSLISVYRETEDRFFSTLYALCFFALNPLAIVASITLMTCFLLSFLGVLLVPKVVDLCHPSYARLSFFFLILGATTQFFDFYTYPLITYAFPMIVFLAAKKGNCWDKREKGHFTWMLCELAAWLLGYVNVWLLKLASTAMFTSIDIWAIARNGMTASFGVGSDSSLLKTLGACAQNILTPEVRVAILITAVTWVVLLIRNPDWRCKLPESCAFLAIGVVAIVWILLAKRTYEHRFFQYRTLGVLLMGVFGFMSQTAKREM